MFIQYSIQHVRKSLSMCTRRGDSNTVDCGFLFYQYLSLEIICTYKIYYSNIFRTRVITGTRSCVEHLNYFDQEKTIIV
jgi:hypothetical protein